MTLATHIRLDDVLAKIDARIVAYYDAADHAGRPQDARKYEEGAHSLESLRLDMQVLAAQPEPAPAKPEPTTYFVTCEDGSYNLVEDGKVTWSIVKTTRRDYGDSHNPKYPWAALRLFPSGHQVEARFARVGAAKKWLLG